MDKRKVISTIVTMLLLVGLIATLAGCGGKAALIGRWEEEGSGNEFLEFFRDGTVNFDGIKAEWKVEKNRLTFTVLGMMETVDYKVSGSRLTLSDDGESSSFRKVK